MLSFAVNDEDAPLAPGAHRPQEQLDLRARLGDAHAVQIDARVDRVETAPQLAKHLGR